MDLNQPLYLNVVFYFKYFLRSQEGLRSIFFFLLSVQNALFQDRFNFRSDRSNLHFFMKSHLLDQGFPSFKNPKLASCVVKRDTIVAIPFGYPLISYFGVFGCQENPTFLLFEHPNNSSPKLIAIMHSVDSWYHTHTQ